MYLMYFDTVHVTIFHEMEGQETVQRCLFYSMCQRPRIKYLFLLFTRMLYPLLNSDAERPIRIRFAIGKRLRSPHAYKVLPRTPVPYLVTRSFYGATLLASKTISLQTTL